MRKLYFFILLSSLFFCTQQAVAQICKEDVTVYPDQDEDGKGDSRVPITINACAVPFGYVFIAGDCDDTDPSVYTGAPELCDGKDNNCDGTVDNAPTLIYYRDADGDGYGTNAQTTSSKCPVAGFVLTGGDCADDNPAINPGAPEVCDGIDNNCNGATDEGVSARLYVKWNAAGANNGTSWVNAFTKLQDALAKANSCSNVVEIWVAEGNYYPDETTAANSNDRFSSFYLKTGLAIYGGFAGAETVLNQRNWTTHVTILSGEIQQDSDNSNNSYHIVRSTGLLTTAVLDGFTIAAANANGVNDEGTGGGMYNLFSSTTVANCSFINNKALTGGAMTNDRSQGDFSVTVMNCNFSGNTSYYGGAIYNVNQGNSQLINCRFTNNTAAVQGGAVYNYESFPTLTNSLFYTNTASKGGAVVNAVHSHAVITNCSFSGNSGGAIFHATGTSAVVNCIVWGNTGGENIYPSGLPPDNAVTFSIVQGGFAGTGNLDSDPLFVDQVSGNLHLQICSPAINTGSNAAIPAGVITDLDGNARVAASKVDMGAYEVSASSFVATTTSITSGNNPSFTSDPGLAVEFTATVTSNGNPVATGTVAFTLGAFALGSAPLNSSGQATLFNSFHTEGSYNITATYNATCQYSGSSGSIVQTANNHTSVTGNTFCNDRSGITINSANARPYPSHIFVSGLSDPITKLRVKLNGFSHQQVSNVSALLVAPGGQKMVLMGAADNGTASVVNLVFDDDATTYLPSGNVLVSGTYRPSFHFPVINFPAPAPAVSVADFPAVFGTATLASKFNGIDPNGTWSLYVLGATLNGSIASWCLEITTDVPPAITCPQNMLVNTDANQCSASVNFAATATGIPAPDIVYKIGEDIITPPYNFAKGITTVTAIATNRAGTDQCSFTVTVNDVQNPSLTVPPDITAYTGTGANICGKLISATDLGIANYGDNCPGAVLHITGISSGNIFPVGETILTYTVTDAAGLKTTATQKVTVIDNTAPVLTCPANITVYTGTRTTCDQVATWTAPVPTDNCGIKSLTANYTSGSVFAKGTTTVTYTATDINDNVVTCSFTVTVIDNTAPVITGVTSTKTALWPPNHKMEDVYIGYTAADNCGNVITSLSVTSNQPINGTGDGDTDLDWIIVDNHHVKLRAERGNSSEARIYTITIRATDGTNITTTPLTVMVAHNITGPVSGTSFKVGSTVAFSGVFWDKPTNRHTANWTVDDNVTVKAATITEPSGIKNGKVTGSYKFTSAGVYKLKMNVTDQNGVISYANTNEDMEAIVVIYDPNGGYTYGGGQFVSPKGALLSNPLATGKVSYGFAINYYKGATSPKGEAQFEFKVGNFEFNALNFDYLSIGGAKAVIKGSGKIIGGQSGINFMMYVTDGALDGTKVDKIRIRIYNKNTGQVSYDNQPGASDAANPTTVVATGSTVVVSNTAVTASSATASRGVTAVTDQPVSTEFLVKARPNPTYTNFQLTVKGADSGKEIKMVITDILGRVIEQRIVTNEQTIMFGDKYIPGMYIVNIVQDKQSRQLKLVKLPE